MLTIYRRHIQGCLHRHEGRRYRRCRCPIWVQGTVGGSKIRRTTGLRNWEKAQALIRDWEAEGEADEPAEEITVDDAIQDFMADLERRKLGRDTVRKYQALLRQLAMFSQQRGIRFLMEFDLPILRTFCGTWRDGNLTTLKKLERLKSFFNYAEESEWIDYNPTRKIKRPKVTHRPTLPFTREQTAQVLRACDEYTDSYGRSSGRRARQLRALVLLLRFSGLRIGDAVTLAKNRVSQGKLMLYTQKTGVPVYCPLPDFVVEALESFESSSDQYYFWSGTSTKESVAGDYRRSLRKVFRSAGIPDGHPHRFRDTFAVELLMSGVPLERLAVLLGHKGTKVTEKHYSPWVKARQEQLEADVRRIWQQDLAGFPPAKGTQRVRRQSGVVN